MIRSIAAGLMVLAAANAFGEETTARRPGRGTRLDVFVPVDPRPPETRWLHRHDRRLVPPTVSIGGTPYVCDVDALSFASREAFVAHLRWEHALAPERIPDLLYRADGKVHYAGE